jgi:hypothetical protein
MVAVIDRARAKLEALRQSNEEREAQYETQARANKIQREEEAVRRRGAGKLSQEGFQRRYVEAEQKYQTERRTPEARLGGALTNFGRGAMKLYTAVPQQQRQRAAPQRKGRVPKSSGTDIGFKGTGLLGSAGGFFSPPKRGKKKDWLL